MTIYCVQDNSLIYKAQKNCGEKNYDCRVFLDFPSSTNGRTNTESQEADTAALPEGAVIALIVLGSILGILVVFNLLRKVKFKYVL